MPLLNCFQAAAADNTLPMLIFQFPFDQKYGTGHFPDQFTDVMPG
jgi:hypothetical protein